MKLSGESRRYRDSLRAQYLQQSRGILHLGAHLGQEAEMYSQAGKPVLWVEAMPDIHARLAKSLERFPNQRCLCALLGDADGVQRLFHVSSNAEGVSSSLFRFGPYANGKKSLWPALRLQTIRKITLPMVTLDRLLKDNAVEPAEYNYWVVDLQGAEILALKGAPAALRNCLALYIEVSKVAVYADGPLWPELRAFVESAGFMPLWEPELDHDDVLFVRAAQKEKAREEFQSGDYLRHNESRLEHLASLRLDFRRKSVLEVGAGIGDHTAFYLERGCKVTVTDIRPENIAVLEDRFAGNPNVEVRTLDMDHPTDLGRRFDIVHCYGILYHLEHPAEALAFLARHCDSLLLVESCVTPGDELRVNLLPEPTHHFSQAFHGKGCRPTRAWIWEQLKKSMPHVYATRTQPAHEEFPLDWIAVTANRTATLKRAVFVASRISLGGNPEMLELLPERQVCLEKGGFAAQGALFNPGLRE